MLANILKKSSSTKVAGSWLFSNGAGQKVSCNGDEGLADLVLDEGFRVVRSSIGKRRFPKGCIVISRAERSFFCAESRVFRERPHFCISCFEMGAGFLFKPNQKKRIKPTITAL